MKRRIEDREEGFNKYLNHEEKSISIHPLLAHNLLCLLEAAKSNHGDVVLVIDGEEGSGKSTLGQQCGKLLDTSLDESRIEFSPEEAIEAHFRDLPTNYDPEAYNKGHYKNKPWQVVILDESARLERSKTMSTASYEFRGFLSQSRQLHKIFIIILPNAHMLEGYVAEHRAVALIHCYKHKGLQLGFFNYYSRKHIRRMFRKDMHSRKLYPKKFKFDGRFSGRQAFDLTNYNIKKAVALKVYRRAEGLEKFVPPEKLQHAFELAAQKRCLELGLTERHVMKSLDIPLTTWKTRKKAMVASGEVKPAPKVGSKKRAKEALESVGEGTPIYNVVEQYTKAVNSADNEGGLVAEKDNDILYSI